jgi:hypothetical protein
MTPTDPDNWTNEQKGESAARLLKGQECNFCDNRFCPYANKYGPCEFWEEMDFPTTGAGLLTAQEVIKKYKDFLQETINSTHISKMNKEQLKRALELYGIKTTD